MPAQIHALPTSSPAEMRSVGIRSFASAAAEWLARSRRPSRTVKLPMKIGVSGWRVANGLGYQTADMVRHLDVNRWLVPLHPKLRTLRGGRTGCRTEYAPLSVGPLPLRTWCRGLDWMLFAERPYFPGLARLARRQGVSVACVPNWERFHPELDWLPDVDLMICPTRRTYLHVADCRDRYGFRWEIACVPWPVDARRFRFRLRQRCNRFLFVNGWGGCRGRRTDGTITPYSRKGIELVIDAARLAPHLSFLVYSQMEETPTFPPNVVRRSAPKENGALYHTGDVCIQPSHWEGIGLQLLECQAAGLPLITTDAAPMNEYQPFETVAASRAEIVFVKPSCAISAPLMCAEDLVGVLNRVAGSDISEASRAARRFIDSERSWDTARPMITRALATCRSSHH